MTADEPAPTPDDVPALGLGTWKLTGDTATEVVADALETGYRHIDTAQLYDNELEVGRGIRRVDPQPTVLSGAGPNPSV